MLHRLVLGLAFLLAVLAPAAARELAIGVSQYPTTFNPLTEASVAQSVVNGMIRRPLTLYDPDWELVCGLCVELPTFENGLAKRETTAEGREGVAVTFTLRPDAVWGDGTPVTAEDVLFTWEVGRHPKAGVIGGEGFRRILSIDRIDDRTFTFHLDRLDFTYNAFNLELLPAHLERSRFEANPVEYRTRTAFDTDPTNPALFFGPYRIVKVTPGAEIVLEPNPTWYGDKPAFERIRLVTISNTAALEANLLSGAIDMISGEIGLNTDQALAFERRHGEEFRVLYKAGLFYEHIDLFLESPRFADVRVRRALLYAIDREGITAKLFAGKQPVALTNISPLDEHFTDDVPTYPYDPDRARQLLDEAGWTLGGDGLRRNDKGETLSLSFVTTAGERTRELVQQVLQSQWKAVGIEARIENQPARVLFGQSLQRRQFGDMALFGWFAAPNSVPRTTLSSKEIPSADNGWAGQNYSGYSNPEVDALLEEIEVELDLERRKKLYAELQRHYASDLPVLPLYWKAQSFILPRWLEGVTPTGHLGPTTLWIEQWRVAE